MCAMSSAALQHWEHLDVQAWEGLINEQILAYKHLWGDWTRLAKLQVLYKTEDRLATEADQKHASGWSYTTLSI